MPTACRLSQTLAVTMHWHQNLENPQAISSLFPGLDDLSLVELHEVIVHRDGPLLRLRFDVQVVPESLPGRWPSDTNTTQITLAAWGMEALRILGWGTSVSGLLSVERRDNVRILSFTSEGCEIRAQYAGLRVEKVHGYADQRDG